MNNLTVYALEDMLIRVMVHINYGIFLPYEPLFANTVVVNVKSPKRALSIDGVKVGR